VNPGVDVHESLLVSNRLAAAARPPPHSAKPGPGIDAQNSSLRSLPAS
jgi:hypothetical protein